VWVFWGVGFLDGCTVTKKTHRVFLGTYLGVWTLW